MTGWTGVAHLLTARAAAARLGIAPATLGRLRRAGHLPGVLVGRAWRYDPTDLDAYVEAQKTHHKEQ